MPLANQLALSVAALVGYFLGLLEAIHRLPYDSTLRLGAIGLGIAVLVGLGGICQRRLRFGERVLVSLLRAGLSGGVFVLVFEGMRLLLKIGNVGGALVSWVAAGILALLLARLTPARAARPAGTDAVSEADQPTSRAGDIQGPSPPVRQPHTTASPIGRASIGEHPQRRLRPAPSRPRSTSRANER